MNINKLKVLRDNIDAYLASENKKEQDARDEVRKVVDDEIKPLLQEFRDYLDSKSD